LPLGRCLVAGHVDAQDGGGGEDEASVAVHVLHHQRLGGVADGVLHDDGLELVRGYVERDGFGSVTGVDPAVLVGAHQRRAVYGGALLFERVVGDVVVDHRDVGRVTTHGAWSIRAPNLLCKKALTLAGFWCSSSASMNSSSS